MSSSVTLAIDRSMARGSVYRSAARRSRTVEIVDDASGSDALITDDAETAARQAAAGKYALLIDPFRLAAETRKNVETSRTMPARHARFQASVQEVKRALDDGKLGEPGLLRIHDWRDAAQAADATLACAVDLALWMFGCRPTAIYAVERTGYVQAHLGFDRGGMAIVDIDTSLPSENDYYSLSLIGSTGAAYADDHHNMNLLLAAQGTRAMRTSQSEVAVARLIESFVDGVRDAYDFSPAWQETESAWRVAGEIRLAAHRQQALMGGENV